MLFPLFLPWLGIKKENRGLRNFAVRPGLLGISPFILRSTHCPFILLFATWWWGCH